MLLCSTYSSLKCLTSSFAVRTALWDVFNTHSYINSIVSSVSAHNLPCIDTSTLFCYLHLQHCSPSSFAVCTVIEMSSKLINIFTVSYPLSAPTLSFVLIHRDPFTLIESCSPSYIVFMEASFILMCLLIQPPLSTISILAARLSRITAALILGWTRPSHKEIAKIKEPSINIQ